jgi:hypothetical protein
MNDREFIELLNLYVDREISPEDAQRLESEVGTNRERRKLYGQYCRMQKACSMLSVEHAESSPGGSDRRVLAFPSARPWRAGPMVAALAAAACVVAVLGLRYRNVPAASEVPAEASTPAAARPAPDAMDLSLAPDSMKPVFFTRAAGNRQAAAPLFAAGEDSPAQAELNWIGSIHMAPVFSAANRDFLLTSRPDLKGGITDEPQGGRYTRDAVEMTAFRFQR